MTQEYLSFACPKCASNRAMPKDPGMMKCLNCGFTAVSTRFRLEKRPSQRWDEAKDNPPDSYGE